MKRCTITKHFATPTAMQSAGRAQAPATATATATMNETTLRLVCTRAIVHRRA